MKTPEPIEDERAGKPSASGGERMMLCPGSVQMEKEFPPLPDSELSDEGTLIHDAWETGDLSKLNDDQIRIVERLKAVEADALASWIKFHKIPEGATVQCFREKRLWFRRGGTLEPLASAKLDVYYAWKGFVLVIDGKTGFLDVTPAPQNWQLRIQALCVWQELPLITHVRVAVAQCRFKTSYHDCDYTANDLADSEDAYLRGLWLAEQPDSPRAPGDHCRYCSAKGGGCPEAAAYALLPVPIAASQLDPKLRGEGLKAELACRVAVLPPETLTFLYERRSIATGIFDAVTARLKAMPDDQLAALGYAKSEPINTRSVPDPVAALNLLINADILTVEEFQSCCALVLGRVESLVKKRLAAKLDVSQLKALEHLDKILAPAVKLTPQSPRLEKIKEEK